MADGTTYGLTRCLYYTDPNMVRFSARVLNAEQEQGTWKVILDRTCFYPQGGGQPGDRGWIGTKEVMDVRKEAGEIIHRLKGEPESLEAQCRLDEPRRRDFMQQHTGQHILSSVFYALGMNTVSVHLGDEYCTVEVDRAAISDQDLYEVEERANAIVNLNTAVRSRWIDKAELDERSLRRATSRSGLLRVVEIEGVDRVACGGVHCQSTGEAGLIGYLSKEKIRGRYRSYWKIGRRALRDYRQKTVVTRELNGLFSSKQEELVPKTRKLLDELNEARTKINSLEVRYALLVAEELLANAGRQGEKHLVFTQFQEQSQGFIKALTEDLVNKSGVASLIVNTRKDNFQWIIAIPQGMNLELTPLLKELLPLIGGKGGGKAPVWQGAGTRIAAINSFASGIKEWIKAS